MARKLKLFGMMFLLAGLFSLPNLPAQAAYQIPDIGIEYDVPTEVTAGQYVHLPGPVDLDGGGTSGRYGYGYVMMPTDLPDGSRLTVSEVQDVDVVTNTNGDSITRCGEVYAFEVETPTGTTYNEAFTITLPYCNGLMDPDIYTLDVSTDNWARENGTFDYTFFDITTEVAELIIHGVYSTEYFGGELESEEEEEVVEDPVENESEVDTTEEMEEQEEANDDNETEEAVIEAEVTINLTEELVVYPDQVVRIDGTASRLTMPADLPDDTTIQVEDAGDADFVKEVDGLELLGDVLTITLQTPAGTSFEGMFKVTLASQENAEAIYYYNKETREWEAQPGEFNVDKSEITIETNHFSTYGVFGKTEKEEDAPALIETAVGDDGGNLPTTSTNIFNWMLLGGGLIVIGIVFFIIRKKRALKRG